METISPQDLRQHWIDGREIALLDVREEGPYSISKPFFANTVPVSEVELRLPFLIPRLSAKIVVYDDGEGLAERAYDRIRAMGYTNVLILEGGLRGYSKVGELFKDVNAPSKAFGELVEAICHTPSLSAAEVDRLVTNKEDIVIVDARRYTEFNTMSIPTGRSCPGGELVYRIRDAAPSPDTTVIVNCAGRTRSLIGTQSLLNAGIPNKTYALRNGTIGWTLQGLEVDTKRTGVIGLPGEEAKGQAKRAADEWAARVGVPITERQEFLRFRDEADKRTLYTFDVRTPEEHAASSPQGFVSAPGGQLVQAIDEWVAVRGARIVLYDNDGVRAQMTGSWLLQMGWDVYVLSQHTDASEYSYSPRPLSHFIAPEENGISVEVLQSMQGVAVIDLSRSPVYRKGHIPGAWHASGPYLSRDVQAAWSPEHIVLTCPDGTIAAANVKDAQCKVSCKVCYLKGGNAAWKEAGLPLETECRYLSEPNDVYKRPYEGTGNDVQAMRDYIDWELQLIAQLANDGVSRFRVVRKPNPDK